MQTRILIIRPGAPEDQEQFADLPERPGFEALDKIIRPLLGGADLERVRVFYSGQYRDMFVDETGKLKGLPVNARATEIYHNNVRTHDPERYKQLTESDAYEIVGTAVLFPDRQVWF